MVWQQQHGAPTTTTDYDKLYQQDKVKKTYKLMRLITGSKSGYLTNHG
jgi:hypothetical protein